MRTTTSVSWWPMNLLVAQQKRLRVLYQYSISTKYVFLQEIWRYIHSSLTLVNLKDFMVYFDPGHQEHIKAWGKTNNRYSGSNNCPNVWPFWKDWLKINQVN